MKMKRMLVTPLPVLNTRFEFTHRTLHNNSKWRHGPSWIITKAIHQCGIRIKWRAVFLETVDDTYKI